MYDNVFLFLKQTRF